MRTTIIKSIKYILLFYVTSYSLIWAISSTVIQYYISEYLDSYQLVISEESSIRYNPFMAHLEINNLTVAKRSDIDHPVFSLSTLDLEVRLYQLFRDQIYVSEFIIDGLYLNIKTLENTFEVAGVALPESTEDKESDETSFPYRLDMPELNLQNSSIELFIDDASHTVKLKSFVISDFGATLAAQSLLLKIDSEVNQSSLSLDIKADLDHGDGQIFVDLDLSKVKLARFKHLLPEFVTRFEGLVSYNGQHTIQLRGGNINVAFQELSLLMENVAVAQHDHHLILGKEQFNSQDLHLVISDDKVQVEGEATLSLDDFKVFYNAENQVLAAFDNLQATDIEFTSSEGINAVALGDISLTNALFSDDIEDEIPALAQFSLLTIKQTALSAQGLSIGEINLGGLLVDAQLDKEKILLNLVDMGSETEKPPSSEPTEDAEFSIALGEFKLIDDVNIHFTDNSVYPVYQRHVIINTLTTGPIDSQKPNEESPFNILGRSDKYANFEFSGIAQPFANTPVYHLEGFFKEVSLPGISAYIKDALQYEIQSGQLDLGIVVSIKGDEIDGEADVLLRGIELTAADDHEPGSLNDQTSVPFNIALGMLKDSDGNVELAMPLSGDISNPSFGVSGFMTLLVKQATIAAAKDYLMTMFVPYASVVSISIAAGEYALKLRFNDMEYPPGEVSLQAEQSEFLSQFAALLREKEDVHVKLCAVATAADINKPAGIEITDRLDIEKLKAISTQRVHAFKDYMVKKEKIQSSQLLLCTPQINSAEDAKPSLTFET